MSSTVIERTLVALHVAVFAALPIVGLTAGPSYAALIFGLGGVQLVGTAAVRRAPPRLDPVLSVLAFVFAVFSWASVVWSIAPDRSWRGALQVTGIFAASLVVLSPSHRPRSTRTVDRLFQWMGIAFVLGAAILCADALTGYHLQSLLVTGKAEPGTKYNRGADYLALIVWPALARASARRNRACLLLVAGSALAVLMLGLSATGRAAGLVGAAALALALYSPRLLARCLAVATAVTAVATPLLLKILAEHRSFIAAHLLVTPHLRQSGLDRLHIWGAMSARVFERPFLGWGLSSAKALPIRGGNYPHNQWLQLWVETGAVGVAIALALALVVLFRVRRTVPLRVQPCALAAFAAAMTISLANFEISTDSWWAALVATASLFALLGDDVIMGAEGADGSAGAPDSRSGLPRLAASWTTTTYADDTMPHRAEPPTRFGAK